MDDRTVIRPVPGGRPPRAAQPAAPSAEAPAYRPRPASRVTPQAAASLDFHDNPVLSLVSPLLSLVGKIQHTHQHPDLDEFHRYALDQIRLYEGRNWGLDGDRDGAFYISYALCALIDETVLNTPWGSTSRWGSDSLLINFHQEAWGGEKFFVYLDELQKRPSANLLLLEFYYVCLVLGFEGRYRQQATGQRELARLQDDLFGLIGRYHDREEQALSPAWRGVSDRRNGIIRYVPYWVTCTLLAGVLLAAYLGYSWQINRVSDITLKALAEVGGEQTLQVEPGNLHNLALPGQVFEPDLALSKVDYVALLAPALKAELETGVVTLVDEPDLTRIRLRHASLFPSGRAELSDPFKPLVAKLGGLLKTVSAPILVAGHSDDIPIFSARFPSNWALSKARADSVGALLAPAMGGGASIRTEGVADMEPLVPNDSAGNRALNRRVEIILRK